MEESANSRDPADRPRGRRRLLDVLPAAEDGGARRGTLERGRARVRRGHVRQGRARLRPHRADRHGRHVPRRQRRLHLASPSARCSSSRSRCSAASPSSPRSSPSSATTSRRRRVPFIGRLRHRNHGESRVWALGDRPRARPPGRRGRRRRRPAARARAPRAEHEDDQPGRRGPPARPADRADLRAHPGRVPRRPAARAGRRAGRGRHHARGPEGHRGAQGDRDRPDQHVLVSPNKQVAIVCSRCPGNGTDDALRRRADARCATTRSRPRSAGSPAPRPT